MAPIIIMIVLAILGLIVYPFYHRHQDRKEQAKREAQWAENERLKALYPEQYAAMERDMLVGLQRINRMFP